MLSALIPIVSFSEYARLLFPLIKALINSAFTSRSGVYFHIPIASSIISASLVISTLEYLSSLSTIRRKYFSSPMLTTPQYVITPSRFVIEYIAPASLLDFFWSILTASATVTLFLVSTTKIGLKSLDIRAI